MIAHGVGVTPVAVYELKRVDSDFFAGGLIRSKLVQRPPTNASR